MWMLRYVAGLVWFVSAPEVGASATSPSQEDTSKGVEVATEPTSSAQPEPEGANKDAPAPAVADQPSAFSEAQRLFKEARILYGTADYEGALELLTKAYRTASKIEDPEKRARILHVLQVNLSQAHVEAWKIDADLEHLRVAKSLLARHLSREEDEESESRRAAEVLMTFIEESLAKAEDEAATEPSPTPPVEMAGGLDEEPRDRGKMSAFQIAGYTALACGGLGLGVMGGGMAIAAGAQSDFDSEATQDGVDAAERRGKTGNLMAIAGGASAGVFAATGVVLLVLDKRRRDRAGQDTTARLQGVAPLWTGETVGISLGGRF